MKESEWKTLPRFAAQPDEVVKQIALNASKFHQFQRIEQRPFREQDLNSFRCE